MFRSFRDLRDIGSLSRHIFCSSDFLLNADAHAVPVSNFQCLSGPNFPYHQSVTKVRIMVNRLQTTIGSADYCDVLVCLRRIFVLSSQPINLPAFDVSCFGASTRESERKHREKR